MPTNKRNKGLSAVFNKDIDDLLDEISNNDNSSSKDKEVVRIPLNEIRANPYQPRKTFNQESLKELSDSILEHGVFTPIIVRKSLSGYELIAGERRLKASKLANQETIPAIVVEIDDKEMMEVSLLENIQREDLNIIEEARGYEQILNRLNYTQEDLAKRIGKSRPHITNILRLLKLPNSIVKLLEEDKISFGHARALLNIEDKDYQEFLANEIVSKGLSVREVEAYTKKKVKNKTNNTFNPYLDDVRKTLERKYSTSVKITNKTITISYNGNDDLNRILELMDAIENNN